MIWSQEFIFSGNINKLSIVFDSSGLNKWNVLLTLCNHLFVDTTKNACIIHTTKSDVQLHHTQITSSGICKNIHVLFLVVSNIRFKSPVCFIYVTLHSLKGMDFFFFHRALWLLEKSRLLIFPTITDEFRKCTKYLSLWHSILSYIFRNTVICTNNAIYLFLLPA